MTLFVRMLEKQKWDNKNLSELEHGRTPADTITGDLRTKSNTLSLWSIETKDKLNDAILALAVMRNQLARLDILIIEGIEIEEKGLEFENTPDNAKTPLTNFDEYHYDLINLTYDKLGSLSQLIIKNLTDTDKCIRYLRSEVAEVLYEGFQNQKFDLDDLDDKLKKDLLKVINRKEKE